MNLDQDLIAGWNADDTDAMGAVLTAHSLVVGFDGSQMVGVAHRVDERWVVALFQTTPAQLHAARTSRGRSPLSCPRCCSGMGESRGGPRAQWLG